MRLYYFIFLAMLLASCDDRIKFDYEDAKRSKIEYFFEKGSDLNFHHDLDKGEIEGYFRPRDKVGYYWLVDSTAKANNWTKVIDDNDKKMYIRKEGSDYSVSTLTFLNDEIHIKMYTY